MPILLLRASSIHRTVSLIWYVSIKLMSQMRDIHLGESFVLTEKLRAVRNACFARLSRVLTHIKTELWRCHLGFWADCIGRQNDEMTCIIGSNAEFLRLPISGLTRRGSIPNAAIAIRRGACAVTPRVGIVQTSISSRALRV